MDNSAAPSVIQESADNASDKKKRAENISRDVSLRMMELWLVHGRNPAQVFDRLVVEKKLDWSREQETFNRMSKHIDNLKNKNSWVNKKVELPKVYLDAPESSDEFKKMEKKEREIILKYRKKIQEQQEGKNLLAKILSKETQGSSSNPLSEKELSDALNERGVQKKEVEKLKRERDMKEANEFKTNQDKSLLFQERIAGVLEESKIRQEKLLQLMGDLVSIEREKLEVKKKRKVDDSLLQ